MKIFMPQIHFNGKTYNDLAEMPATEREMDEKLYEWEYLGRKWTGFLYHEVY